MSVNAIFGESSLNEPEAVDTLRTTGHLWFSGREFSVPFISPRIDRMPQSAALFAHAVALVAYAATPVNILNGTYRKHLES